MPRLTIIGTSHVGAFKEGWEAIAPRHPSWSVSFFAATSQRFRSLRLTPRLRFGLPNRLAEENSDLTEAILRVNNATSIDLSAADAVLWAGYRHPFDRLAAYLAGHDVEGLLVRGDLPLVTRAAFDAACAEIATAASPADRWLGWERTRLLLHNSPLPSETLIADGREKHAAWVALAARPSGQRAAIDAFLAIYERALGERGVGLLRPPEETRLDNGLTAARYGAGSRRLGSRVEHPTSDHDHMNAEYGGLALEALFAQIGPSLADADAKRARRAARRGSAPAAAPPEAAPASPYLDLPPRAYWRTGVAERAPLDPGDLYRPRFAVTRDMRIATAGSCFAQHVGRALRGAAFNVLDAEPAPGGLSEPTAARLGYGAFSGRFGNIYTARQLRQLLDEAEGRTTPALPVWTKGARFFDAQRPGVEPEGCDSADEVLARREAHLARLRPMFREADVFVFTFGLTEAWLHRTSGTVYPTAPGTIAGDFDPDVFAFHNFDALEVLADFEAFRAALQAINPGVRFLVTVSPVPLTATATGEHVEVATCYSKAVLRAACGMLVARHADIDYFPSYEIITSQNARGAYYEPNGRSVSPMGVQTAMRLFLNAHGAGADAATPAPARHAAAPAARGDDPCEDALLDAFVR